MEELSIRKYAGLMRELGLTALEINEDGKNVRLEMGAQQAVPVAVAPAPAAPPAAKSEAGVADVTSPMVGVFYASPAENAEPYVKVGDRVKRGDILCIIEAMKLMNEITAEAGGTLHRVMVENGHAVEQKQVLMYIKPR